jgi:hypothetical protein
MSRRICEIPQARLPHPNRKPRTVLRNANGGFELHTYGDPRVATIAGAFATSFASAQDESGNVFLAVLDQWGALLLARFNAAA